MLAFKDDLLRAGLEGDPNAVAALSGAVGRTFVSPGVSMPDPAHFGAFRGGVSQQPLLQCDATLPARLEGSDHLSAAPGSERERDMAESGRTANPGELHGH